MTPHGERATVPGLALPPTFDLGRDVLVWLGPASAELPRGPRVFVVAASDEDGAAPEGVQRVASSAELFRALLALSGAAPRHALVHRTPGTAPTLQRELAETLRNALHARAMQQKTLEESGRTWLLQGLANLPALADHPTIATLAGAFAGRPCVLVSPGPSLSKNVGQLRALSERALVVSGTHALSALARAGVAPHVVVCADPGDLARHWAGVDLAAVEAFVLAATCHASTLAAPARRRFTFAGNGSTDAWLFEALGAVPGLATGGSVACSMLSLALHLGCDPIVFVGQDLSFGERFYAAEGLDGDAEVAAEGAEFVLVKPAGATGIGTPLADGRLQFTVPQRVLEVPGWAGGTVKTTPQLKAFLDWLVCVTPELRGTTRVLNCTEGGAHIAGMEHVTLADASAAWPIAPPVAPALERAGAALDRAARRRDLAAWTERTLAALGECTRLARSCGARASGKAKDTTALGKLEKELSAALRRAPLVSLVAQAEIVAAKEEARLARTLAENLAAARKLYGIVARASELLTEPLHAAGRALV